MADRRPWPSSKPPEEAVSIAVKRARALKRVSSPELHAFLVGLRTAQVAAEDLAEETYGVADAATDEQRAKGMARAGGNKAAAARIGALFDAVIAEAMVPGPPSRRGIRKLMQHLVGSKP